MREHVPFDAFSGGGQADLSPVFDLVCFSHLRWDFVYQRPQHLLSRCAEQRRVFFFEEPVFIDGPARLDISQRDDKLFVVTPLLPCIFLFLSNQLTDWLQMQPVNQAMHQEVDALQREFVNDLLERTRLKRMCSGTIPQWRSPFLNI